jgi:molybdenum cofactor cytidylyltransferase
MKLTVGILAAGLSRRLGQAKQLVIYQGMPLVVRQIQAAAAINPAQILVSTGAHQMQVAKAIRSMPTLTTPLSVLPVEDFQSGMAASIRTIAQACMATDCTHLMIMLVDQYLITPEHLNRLADIGQVPSNQVVATSVKGTRMPPVIFPRLWFDRLTGLQGDQGAKHLLRNCDEVIDCDIEIDPGDIDSPEDCEKLG